MGLPRHRPESAHCQNNHSETATCSRGASAAETAALAREILQDRAGLENRDRRAVGPSGSMIAGIRLLGEIARKLGSNCSPRPWTVHRSYGKPHSSSTIEISPPFGVGH